MTDEPTETAVPATALAETASAAANSLSNKGKTFWMGVGIGSAAIVAAVMYARRPKKKK